MLRPLVGGTFAAMSKLADSPKLFSTAADLKSRLLARVLGHLLRVICKDLFPVTLLFLGELFWK